MKVSIRNSFDDCNNRLPPDARVFIDVFRASTTSVAVFDAGMKELLVANDLELLRQFALEGYLVISEVFDLGIDNSPTLVRQLSPQTDKAILKTSNLTTAIAANTFEGTMVVAGFNNLGAVAEYFKNLDYEYVEILPAGQMEQKVENMEDSFCAQVLADVLLEKGTSRYEKQLATLHQCIEQKVNEKERPSHYVSDLDLAIRLNCSEKVPLLRPVGDFIWSMAVFQR